MKIGIVVHGRFHAFDFARELIRAGQDVCLITNYPKHVAERFGIPRSSVKTNLFHGIVSRLMQKLDQFFGCQLSEPFTHRWFGRWAASVVAKRHFDIVHGFSGVCEEMLRTKDDGALKTLMRASSHIRVQHDLLEAEEQRVKQRLEKPSQWRIAREEREYAAADLVTVMSSFCRETFLSQSFSPSKVQLLISAVSTKKFQAPKELVDARIRRILDQKPLRALTVGAFSYRKGIFDLAEIANSIPAERVQFRFVGKVLPEGRDLAKRLEQRVEFIDKVPQNELPQHYAWGDVFLFPTIEDGFPAVLAQASAAALPILTTPNGAGHDLVVEGQTGWILPIRKSSAFVSRLNQCCDDRPRLADMVTYLSDTYVPRDFAAMARDFLGMIGKYKELNVTRV